MKLTRYPLDTTGRSPTNYVENERHMLDVDDEFRVILPREGAYYNDSLVVKQGNKTLELNKDYLYTFLWQDATWKLGMGVSTAFQIINKNLAGEITICYQVVGGEYAERIEGLDNLIQTLPIHTRMVYWDEVREKPDAYWPARHLHHINDVFGLSKLIGIIDELRRSLEGQSVLKLKAVYDRFLKLKQYVEANLKDVDKIRIELARALDKIEKAEENFITKNNVETIVTEIVVDTIGPEIDARLIPLQEKDAKQQEQIDALRSDLTDIANKVGEDLQERLTALETDNTSNKSRLDKLELELPTAVDSLIAEIGNQSQKLDQRITATDNKLVAEATRLDQSIDAAKREAKAEAKADNLKVKQSLESLIDTTKADLDKKIDDTSKALSNQFNNKQADLENTVAELNRKVDTNKQTTDDSITTLANEISTTLQEYVREEGFENRVNGLIDTKLTPVEHHLNQQLATLSDKVDENKRTTDQQNLDTNLRIDALDTKVERYNKENDVGLDAFKEQVTGLLQQNKDDDIRRNNELNDRYNNLEAAINTKIDQNKDALQTKIDAVKRDSESRDTSIQRQIANLETALKSNRDESDQTLRDEINRLNQDLTNKIDSNKTELSKGIEVAKSEAKRANEVLRADLNTAKQSLKNALDNATNDLTQKIDQVKTDSKTELDKVKTELNTAIATKADEAGLDERINNVITAITTSLEAGLNERIENDNAASNQRDQDLAKQISALNSKTDAMNQLLGKSQADILAKIDTDIEAVKETLTEKITDEVGKVDDELKQAIKSSTDSVNQSLDEANARIDQIDTSYKVKDSELENRIVNIERNGTNKEELSTLNNRVTELEARPIPREDFNPDQETINALVNTALDKRLAELRDKLKDEAPNVPDVPISKPDETTIRFNEAEENRNYYIQTMVDSSSGKVLEESYRTVYAPIAAVEFERSGEWTIPDDYDGVLAQVFVTTALKGNNLPSGRCLVYPPCTKMGYVLLKGGTTVPITVGSISSFGTFLTNDGIDRKGLLVPTYPITMDMHEILTSDDDIRNYFGKYGRVAIYV